MMRKFLLINIIFFIFSNCLVFSFSEEELINLELSRYGRSYSNESLSERLSRLETDILGMSQNGDIDSRIDTLLKVGNNIVSRAIFYPDENIYVSTKKQNPIKNFWNNIYSSFEEGIITGFTPPITYGGYGSSNSIYGNNALGSMNNSNYCPYHNSYHNKHYHRPYYNNGYNNRNRIGVNPYYGTNPNGRYNIPQNMNTNTIARSSVHMLQD